MENNTQKELIQLRNKRDNVNQIFSFLGIFNVVFLVVAMNNDSLKDFRAISAVLNFVFLFFMYKDDGDYFGNLLFKEKIESLQIKLKSLKETPNLIGVQQQGSIIKNSKLEIPEDSTKSNTENYVSIEDNFNILKNITNTEQVSLKSLPPEKLYGIPRKIDWDTLNEKRKITGLKGEEIVFILEKNYFKSINREDLANKVRHISIEKGDGSGYDILSFTVDGKEKYIEVKSTSQSSNSSFYLSKNELNFLKNHPQDAFVYRILNINDNEEPLLKVYSSDEILNSNQITPVQYIVKME